jgi:hypothetical protein
VLLLPLANLIIVNSFFFFEETSLLIPVLQEQWRHLPVALDSISRQARESCHILIKTATPRPKPRLWLVSRMEYFIGYRKKFSDTNKKN